MGKGMIGHDSLEVTLVGWVSSFSPPMACPMAQVLEGPEEIAFWASFWLKRHKGLAAPT